MNQPSDEIKDRLDIVDVIQDYIQLKKVGANYKACCPFHNEKTPSFMVSQDKQIWHCFGCGKGGDMFSFVQEMEGVEFVDALRSLAQKAGIKLKRQNPQVLSQQSRLKDALELAAEFFHKSLLQSKAGKTAREYLKERQIIDRTIVEFKLGYTPDLWDALINFMHKRGYEINNLLATGLIIKREGREGYYDRFRHRLMFPIADASGRVVGFGGRIIPGDKAEEAAKYINSPQTQLYDKSRILYGMDKAKMEIRKRDLAVIVEGYMDVITSHQAGVKNVVAASGTALTVEQINLIKRYTQNIVLAFDMDVAGDTAAKRGIDIVIENDMNVRIARLPEGLDPDDTVKKNVKIWEAAIKNAQSIMDYYFISTMEGLDLKNVDDKKKATTILIPQIAKIVNDVEKAHYIHKLAEMLNVEEQILYDFMNKLQAPESSPTNQIKSEDVFNNKASGDGGVSLSLQLLSYLFNFPEYIEKKINDIKINIIDSDYQNLYIILQNYYNDLGKDFDYTEFVNTIKKNNQEVAQQAAMVELYLQQDNFVSEIGDKDVSKDIDKIIINLKRKFLKNKMANIHQAMKIAENNKNKEELDKLSVRFDKLSQQLSKLNL